MLESVHIAIVVSIVTLAIILYHFWRGTYYRNNKFKILLTLITTVTSIMFSSAIIIQVLNYNNQKANEEIDRYNSLSKVFLDDILETFMEHPEMNYYYDELVGVKTIDKNTKRNYILENQIVCEYEIGPLKDKSFSKYYKDMLVLKNIPNQREQFESKMQEYLKEGIKHLTDKGILK